MEHHFNIEIAKKCGILEAILLQNIYFWVEHNRANDKSFYDGEYWTFNSIKAFEQLFPYVSGHQIRRALEKLRNDGYLKTGYYNKSAYDRTMWYTLTDLGFSMFTNEKVDLAENTNQIGKNATPIPYNKHISKTHIKNNSIGEIAKRFTPPTLEEVKEYCKERKNGIDAEQFIDFYESKGWKVGNQKMKDWKAAVRTWERRESKATTQTAIIENGNETMNSRWVFDKWEQYLGFRPERTTANIESAENLVDLDGMDGVERLIVALRMRSEHGFLSKEIKNVKDPASLWENRDAIWMFYNKNQNQWKKWAENAKMGKKKWEI